jgi:hypothetical protein
MEIQKASNLLEHEAEIKARPARTWFQSTSEKNASKSASFFLSFSSLLTVFPSSSVVESRRDDLAVAFEKKR